MTEVLGLSIELRRRGIRTRVDVSDPDQVVGQAQYDALRRMIRDESDGFVLYVTRNMSESACIWNVEIPTALDAFDRGDLVFVPVFRDLLPAEASRLEPHGRRIGAIGGVVLPQTEETVALRAAHIDAAKTILGAALRQRTQQGGVERLIVGLRTRTTGADAESVDLLLDWERDYDRALVGGTPAHETVQTALQDIRQAVAGAGFREIRVVGPAHLSAGFALGYAFPRPSGFRLETAYEQIWWPANGDEEPADIEVLPMQLDPGAPDLLLVLALSRPEVVGDVDAALGSLNLPIAGRVVVRSTSEPSRTAVRSGAHARGIARTITDALMHIRADWGLRGRTHVFMAGPLPVAILLGHALNAFGPLRVYERTPDNRGYVGLLDL
jgi:hypothetical protein